MSWLDKLYKTYEANTSRIGDPNDATPLLPVCHTIQNAQVHVVLDGTGSFVRASVVPKNDAKTVIPASEEAAGRSGTRPVAYPLCDKLQYLAADLVAYGGEVTSGFARCPTKPHEDYLEQLAAWCASPYSHPKAQAVLTYLRQGRLVKDLVSAGVLHVDGNGALLGSWPGDAKRAPDIFRVVQGQAGQSGAFVRFSVEVAGDAQAALWTDKTLWESWAEYYASTKALRGLCYVTGEDGFVAEQHPKNIRRGGDGAKLISSNDTAGYTFLGRFTSADEACGVGFEVTQKAHNALRWLIGRQRHRDGDQAIVAWAVNGEEIPDPFADTSDLIPDQEEPDETPQGGEGYTAQDVGVRLSKRIAGYAAKVGKTTDVVVMGLDSATPGRMSINFYRELTGSDLLARVEAWHAGCSWLQRFSREKVFAGAPAPQDIADAAYASRLDDKLRKATVERLLPCIIDGAVLPPDLVGCCVRRACSRHSMEYWEWEKTLGIACALYRYRNKGKDYTMALERDRTSRDYLYGRLLALAEHLEGRALYVASERRETNAGRLMQRFAERPCATWLTIAKALSPYKERLRTRRSKFLYGVEVEIDDVVNSFSTNDFISDQPLTGEFLLGYHCQRAALRKDATPDSDGADDDEE